MMRLLADEGFDRRWLRWLQRHGWEVVDVVDIAPGATDTALADLARERALLVATHDPDFAKRLRGLRVPVILLRLEDVSRAEADELLRTFWAETAEYAADHIVTVSQSGIHARHL